MFLTISSFLVIDDNTIKTSINFVKIDKLNHLHLLNLFIECQKKLGKKLPLPSAGQDTQ